MKDGRFTERKDFYKYGEPKEITRERLEKIEEAGMEEVGIAQFGFKGICSGFYIEHVWNESAEDFKRRLDWMIGLRNEKNQSNG